MGRYSDIDYEIVDELLEKGPKAKQALFLLLDSARDYFKKGATETCAAILQPVLSKGDWYPLGFAILIFIRNPEKLKESLESSGEKMTPDEWIDSAIQNLKDGFNEATRRELITVQDCPLNW